MCMACAHPAKFPDFYASLFHVGREGAVPLIPDSKHPCVSQVLSLIGKDFDHRVLSREEDWEKEIRILVESITAKRTA